MQPKPSSSGAHGRSTTRAAEDLRAEPREVLEAPVRIRFLSAGIDGCSENISEAGILLVTDRPLEVSIEFEGRTGTETRTGRIVRMQRMGASSTGFAVEFDPV